MAKKNKQNRMNRRPRQGQAPSSGPVLSRHLAPGEEQISEVDFLKIRLAKQKLQTLNEKQGKIKVQQESLAKEQENLRLRVALMQSENLRDLGHLGNIDINNDNIGEKTGTGIFVLIRAAKAPGAAPVPGRPPVPPIPSKPLEVLKDDDDDTPEDDVEPGDRDEGDEDDDDMDDEDKDEEEDGVADPEPELEPKSDKPGKGLMGKKSLGTKKKK